MPEKEDMVILKERELEQISGGSNLERPQGRTEGEDVELDPIKGNPGNNQSVFTGFP